MFPWTSTQLPLDEVVVFRLLVGIAVSRDTWRGIALAGTKEEIRKAAKEQESMEEEMAARAVGKEARAASREVKETRAAAKAIKEARTVGRKVVPHEMARA